MRTKSRRVHKRRGLVGTAKKDVSKIGRTTKNIATGSISKLYNFLSSGFSTGVKGVKGVEKDVTNVVSPKRRRHRSRKTRRH
jgi:hypothetical protein